MLRSSLRSRLHLRSIRLSSSFSRPSPPKLPAAQQAEFERLQRSAASPASLTSSSSHTPSDTPSQGLFRGAPPEFAGDKNPKTGEVGGPKNEPLRWGGKDYMNTLLYHIPWAVISKTSLCGGMATAIGAMMVMDFKPNDQEDFDTK